MTSAFHWQNWCLFMRNCSYVNQCSEHMKCVGRYASICFFKFAWFQSCNKHSTDCSAFKRRKKPLNISWTLEQTEYELQSQRVRGFRLSCELGHLRQTLVPRHVIHTQCGSPTTQKPVIISHRCHHCYCY